MNLFTWHKMKLTGNINGVRLCLTDSKTHEIVDIAICELSASQISTSIYALEQHHSFSYPAPEVYESELSLADYIYTDISNAWAEEEAGELANA